MEERVMVFIDGSNLYKSLLEAFGNGKIRIDGLVEKLCQGRKLIRAIYYNATIPVEKDPIQARNQQKFFDAVERMPFMRVEKGRVEKREEIWVEKGVDIMIATDMIRYAIKDVYDVAILVSSDGDFKYVVDVVADLGKHVINAYVVGHRAYHLNICDDHIEIDDDYIEGLRIT